MVWALAAVLRTGCTLPASPFYYCVQIVLHHPSGKQIDALECTPRARPVPWKDHPGPELLSGR